MKKIVMKTKGFLFTVAAAAMAFTFSCSSDEGKEEGEDRGGEDKVSSSSSGGGDNPSSPSVASSVLKCGGEEYDPETHYCSVGTIKEYGLVTYGEQTYKTVVIGTQTWFAGNLNYAGDDNSKGKCLYSSAECAKYGRVYNWYTAGNVCPAGWHLPSKAEWETLMNFVGDGAGTKLKAKSGWSSSNGTDDYGFSALPSNYYNSENEQISRVTYGSWWTATQNVDNIKYQNYKYIAYKVTINPDGGNFISDNIDNIKFEWYSVRCVQNAGQLGGLRINAD